MFNFKSFRETNFGKTKDLIEDEHTVEIQDPSTVPVFNYDNLDVIPYQDNSYGYNNFFEECLIKNRPCILTNVTSKWQCLNNWITDSKINYDYLEKKYENSIVSVADCNQQYFNSHVKHEMKFHDYIRYFKSSSSTNKLLYLKDWHCQKEHPDDTFYEVPYFFTSDWLNEYALSTNSDDYMFVYMGPKGTWTPFHADVYNSYSWSVNLFGKKKWRLYLPGQENYLKDQYGNLPYDCLNVQNSSTTTQCKYFTIIQEAGSAIFVPSGWYHQVWNLEDTISINHNWINGCNVHILWENLQKELKRVEKEIEDCKDSEDWSEMCQNLLRASFGMNYLDFYDFLYNIGSTRINTLMQRKFIKFFNQTFGVNHIIFDLLRIKNIMLDLLNKSIFSKIKRDSENNIVEYVNQINEVLNLKKVVN